MGLLKSYLLYSRWYPLPLETLFCLTLITVYVSLQIKCEPEHLILIIEKYSQSLNESFTTELERSNLR